MNKNIFLNGFVISFLFLVAKFIEMRFITKKNIAPKILFRDTLLVYISAIIAHYILTQLNQVKTKEFVEVFTDSPAF